MLTAFQSVRAILWRDPSAMGDISLRDDSEDSTWRTQLERRDELSDRHNRLIMELLENQWELLEQCRDIFYKIQWPFRENQQPPNEVQQLLDKKRQLCDRNRQIHDQLDELFRQIQLLLN